jgi:hypothetical protein
LEAGTDNGRRRGLSGGPGGERTALAPLLIITLVLLLRVPFLNQPIQGDDVYYLFGAQHALIDPAHPSHAKYIFQGEMVDMRGHPHPPLNSLILAGLIALFGDVYEVPFHAAYILFSLIAALAMWSLAQRFSAYPLGATLLFLAVPAFVINGNSLESDVPFLAFWMAGFALFVKGRLGWSAAALALAAMTAYQAVVATPILMVYCWLHRRSRAAWLVTLTPVITVALYQIYERATGGELPAAVLTGYFDTYGLQQLAKKLENAAALTAHAGWIVFPLAGLYVFRRRWPVALAGAAAGFFIDPHPLFWVSFAVGALVLAWCVRKPDFLTAWILIFFAAALVLFFAGSARYLLPMAAPVAILAARERRIVLPAFALNVAVALCLAVVNYEHWNGYRKFARSIERELAEKRVWINGEWGLRFYLESLGALPLARTQVVQPGEWVVSSALGYPYPVTAPTAVVSEREIRPSLPLRLIGLNSKSGFSAASFGFRPFDFVGAPADRVRAEVVLERKPVLSYLPMKAPEAQTQIVSGVYQLEGEWRWMSGRAVVLLKPPDKPLPLRLKLSLPQQTPARNVQVLVDGELVHEQTLPGPGTYEIATRPVTGSSVTITLDQTFSVPGDHRQLGAILSEIGFR